MSYTEVVAKVASTDAEKAAAAFLDFMETFVDKDIDPKAFIEGMKIIWGTNNLSMAKVYVNAEFPNLLNFLNMVRNVA